MDDVDGVGLAKLASSVSTTATECASVVQAIRHSSGGIADPALDNLHKDLSCFVDASHYLSRQLGTSHASLATDEFDDRFWTSLRLVLELWLKNTKMNLRHLQAFQKQRSSTWMGWFFSSPRFTRQMEDYHVVNFDTRIGEAQLFTTLFNL